jgi:hypothetical protein
LWALIKSHMSDQVDINIHYERSEDPYERSNQHQHSLWAIMHPDERSNWYKYSLWVIRWILMSDHTMIISLVSGHKNVMSAHKALFQFSFQKRKSALPLFCTQN